MMKLKYFITEKPSFISLLFIIMALPGCSTFSANQIPDQLDQLDIQFTSSPTKARTQLNELKTEFKEDARPWVTSGYWSLKEDDIPRANIAFRQAHRLDAKNIQALMGLGICSDKQQLHPQAQDFYQQGLVLDNDNIKLKNNLALSYILSQQPISAIRLLEPISKHSSTSSSTTLLSITEHQRLLSNLSLAYSMNKQFDKAYEIDKELHGEYTAHKNKLTAEAIISGDQ
jgi:cytochrome c-type biogenesis protein CcmH/NrfG